MRYLWLTLASACAPPKGTSLDSGDINDSGTSPSSDTGTTLTDTGTTLTDTGSTSTIAACPPEIERKLLSMCAEASTAASPPSGRATITEIGAALPLLETRIAFGSHPLCDAAHTHQVRLVDEGGVNYTLGWDIEGPLDDDSTDALSIGDEVDFSILWEGDWFTYEALLLSDDVGPLFFAEEGMLLSEPERGLAVGFPEEVCLWENPPHLPWLYMPVSFSTEDTSVSLWAGQSADVVVGGREMEIILGDWSLMEPCPSDWCGEYQWMAFVR